MRLQRVFLNIFLIGLLAAVSVVPTDAEDVRVAAPSFWDPGLQLERPDWSGLRIIRFLTDDDYPPLNFALADGKLAGFNVDIARAVCEELQVGCTIQARRWDTIVDLLLAGKGDAIVASIAATSPARDKIDFTRPYYRTPARFVTRRESDLFNITPAGLAGKSIGVVAGSAHKAFLDAFFPRSVEKTYPDAAAARGSARRRDRCVVRRRPRRSPSG